MRGNHIASAALLLTGAIGGTGCTLLEGAFDASVEVMAEIDGNDPFYNECTTFDPNDSQDFRDNRDKIETGRISNIRITVTSVGDGAGNNATYGLGQIDVRRLAGEPNPNPDGDNCRINSGEFITSIARWDPVPIVRDESFDLDLNPEVLDQLTELVFEEAAPIEVRLRGYTDQGRVNFTFRVEFDLEFTANFL